MCDYPAIPTVSCMTHLRWNPGIQNDLSGGIRMVVPENKILFFKPAVNLGRPRNLWIIRASHIATSGSGSYHEKTQKSRD